MPKSVPHNPGSQSSFPAPSLEAPALCAQAGPYRLRTVRTESELEDVCRLRFRIFNLELGEGLPESFHRGADRDQFDAQCHHLLVEHRRDGVIGTYRLQISETAKSGVGFYSAQEFELTQMPNEVLALGVELGRACIAKDHRNKKVLFLLWRGLAEYATHFDKRYFFGCNSLTTQDGNLGWQTYDWLRTQHHLHEQIRIPVAEAFRIPKPSTQSSNRPGLSSLVRGVPPLFAAYLRYGSKVCSEPALDREFGTIDYLTVLDLHKLNRLQKARFGLSW